MPRTRGKSGCDAVFAHAPPACALAHALAQEMMVMAGEVVGELGARTGLLLPYRSQMPPQLPSDEELEALPEGPCRAVALRRRARRTDNSTDNSTDDSSASTVPLRAWGPTDGDRWPARSLCLEIK